MSTTHSSEPSPDPQGTPLAFYLFIGLMAVCLIGALVYLLMS
jgi:hypothetical protein